MRSLLNFILANLIPIIVVVSIALRIIGGIKSEARKKSRAGGLERLEEPELEEEEYADVWERLKPDEDSPPDLIREKSPGGAAGTSLPPPPEIRPLLMPASSPLPQPRAAPISPQFNPAPLFEPEALPPEPGRETGHRAAEKKSATAFFRRMESLSPLRRAVILAEILGPPRGA